MMRKLFISEILTTKRAKLFQQARDVEIDCMINSLSRSTLVELDEMLYGVMDEIICVVAFGKSFKERRFNGKKLNEVIDEAMVMLDSFSSGDFFPWVGWMLDFINGQRTRLEKCFGQLDDFFRMVLDEHLEQARPKLGHDQDLVDSLVEISKDEGGAFSSHKEPYQSNVSGKVSSIPI